MIKKLFILSIIILTLGSSHLSAQKSDAELFFDYKNELKSLKDYYKNIFKVQKVNDENKVKLETNSFVDKIYQDYQNSSTENLTNMVPEVKESFSKYSSGREKAKNDYIYKLESFLKKWNDPGLKEKIIKVAKDYDFDINDGIQNISDIKSDIDMESNENYERITKFIELIIQDKVELIKLKKDITGLEEKIKSKIAISGQDKKIRDELLSENSKRKDLIFQLVSTIVNEHKLLSSTDYANDLKPSPFASDIYNLLSGFMDDYINISRNIQSDPDPSTLNSSIAAYMDVNLKLDSLYDSMEQAKMIKKGERDDLLTKSYLWKNQIFPTLDNAVLNEFTSRNVPIVFQKTDQSDWFAKSLTEFLNPYMNPNDEVNKDKTKSNDIRKRFTESWESIKTKWSNTLKTAKYLDDRTIADIDGKLSAWNKITGDSYAISSIIIGLLVLIALSIAVGLFIKYRKK
jgi:hypothetical protein